jgi:hypothetical protein
MFSRGVEFWLPDPDAPYIWTISICVVISDSVRIQCKVSEGKWFVWSGLRVRVVAVTHAENVRGTKKPWPETRRGTHGTGWVSFT